MHGPLRAFEAPPREQALTVEVGSLLVVRGKRAQLMSRALGSGVAVSLWDPHAGVSGLLHFVLPAPPKGTQLAMSQVGNCASTGLPLLFQKAFELGARPENLIVCAAGAAAFPGDKGPSIGQLNASALVELLGQRTPLAASDLGGSRSRSLTLDHATGEVCVRSRRRERVLWKT